MEKRPVSTKIGERKVKIKPNMDICNNSMETNDLVGSDFYKTQTSDAQTMDSKFYKSQNVSKLRLSKLFQDRLNNLSNKYETEQTQLALFEQLALPVTKPFKIKRAKSRYQLNQTIKQNKIRDSDCFESYIDHYATSNTMNSMANLSSFASKIQNLQKLKLQNTKYRTKGSKEKKSNNFKYYNGQICSSIALIPQNNAQQPQLKIYQGNQHPKMNHQKSATNWKTQASLYKNSRTLADYNFNANSNLNPLMKKSRFSKSRGQISIKDLQPVRNVINEVTEPGSGRSPSINLKQRLDEQIEDAPYEHLRSFQSSSNKKKVVGVSPLIPQVKNQRNSTLHASKQCLLNNLLAEEQDLNEKRQETYQDINEFDSMTEQVEDKHKFILFNSNCPANLTKTAFGQNNDLNTKSMPTIDTQDPNDAYKEFKEQPDQVYMNSCPQSTIGETGLQLIQITDNQTQMRSFIQTQESEQRSSNKSDLIYSSRRNKIIKISEVSIDNPYAMKPNIEIAQKQRSASCDEVAKSENMKKTMPKRSPYPEFRVEANSKRKKQRDKIRNRYFLYSEESDIQTPEPISKNKRNQVDKVIDQTNTEKKPKLSAYSNISSNQNIQLLNLANSKSNGTGIKSDEVTANINLQSSKDRKMQKSNSRSRSRKKKMARISSRKFSKDLLQQKIQRLMNPYQHMGQW